MAGRELRKGAAGVAAAIAMVALAGCAHDAAQGQHAWVARGERDGRVTLTEASYEPASGVRPTAPRGGAESPVALMQAVEALLGGPTGPASSAQPRRAAPAPAPQTSPAPSRQRADRPSESSTQAALHAAGPDSPRVATAPRGRVTAEALPIPATALLPGDPLPHTPRADIQTGRSRLFSASQDGG